MFFYRKKQTYTDQIKAGLINCLKVFALLLLKVAMCSAVIIYIMFQCTKANVQANYLSTQAFTLKESNKIKKHSFNLDDWLKKYPKIESKTKPTFNYSSLSWVDEYAHIQNHELQNKQLLDESEECEHVFIGDSISYYWLNHQNIFKSEFKTTDNAMIYAHCGDVIHDIGWRLNNGKGFENMKHCLLNGKAEQKNLILLIGTNDIFGGSSYDVALRDYNALLKQLIEFVDDVNKKQKVILHVMAIFPRSYGDRLWKKGNKHYENIVYMNEFLQLFVEHEKNENVKFVDCNEMLLQDYGKFGANTGNVTKEIFRDKLHLSSKGFERWSQCLLKYMD